MTKQAQLEFRFQLQSKTQTKGANADFDSKVTTIRRDGLRIEPQFRNEGKCH
jgi:hypothetical protein